MDQKSPPLLSGYRVESRQRKMSEPKDLTDPKPPRTIILSGIRRCNRRQDLVFPRGPVTPIPKARGAGSAVRLLPSCVASRFHAEPDCWAPPPAAFGAGAKGVGGGRR